MPTRTSAKPVTADEMASALERKQQAAASKDKALDPATWPEEIGGPSGPEPTRYGDWERRGICVDF